MDDTTLYALGLESEEEMGKVITAAMDGTKLEEKISQKWSYEDICNMEFKTILNSDCYSLDEKTGLYTDLRETDAGLKYLYNNALPLKVSVSFVQTKMQIPQYLQVRSDIPVILQNM